MKNKTANFWFPKIEQQLVLVWRHIEDNCQFYNDIFFSKITKENKKNNTLIKSKTKKTIEQQFVTLIQHRQKDIW